MISSEKAEEKISPLRERPLRLPGESTDDQINDIFDIDIGYYFAMVILVVGLALLEWTEWYFNVPPHPGAVAIVACFYVAFAVYRIRKHLARIRVLKQGRDGERVVGQFLEDLRASGCKVFHDVLGDAFNIDHVVIGPQGIFTIETKTWSKASAQETIKFNGKKLVVNGYQTERDPIQQAQAGASWLRGILKKSTGRDFAVRPIIIFPGWYVEQSATKHLMDQGIWLLSLKALPSFIANTKPTLNQEDVNLSAFHLERYVRALS